MNRISFFRLSLRKSQEFMAKRAKKRGESILSERCDNHIFYVSSVDQGKCTMLNC